MLIAMRGWIVNIHAKMTGVSEAELPRIYIEFLGSYKTFIIVFNLVPYIALKIMA